MNEKADAFVLSFLSGKTLLVTTTVVALTGLILLYTPTLNGFWLGDDFGNLYRSWWLHQQGQLASETLSFFGRPVDEIGAFYRPLMIASVSISYAMFGTDYFGWAASSLIVHLINALLIFMLVGRLLTWFGQPVSHGVALLCALIFAFNPVAVEAVVWVSARADGWVTLLSLMALWCWAGNPRNPSPSKSVWLMPVCMAIALGFKESAVILPLQLLLLALIWPDGAGRSRWLSLAIAFLLAVSFMLWRMNLFGSAVEVYRETEFSFTAFTSLIQWWSSLFSDHLLISLGYLTGLLLIVLIGLFNKTDRINKTDRTLRLGVALGLASGGLLLATLINLGGFSSSGEGGRLLYGSLAWASLTIGALAQPLMPRNKPVFTLAIACWGIVFSSSILLLQNQIGQFTSAQQNNLRLSQAVPAWAERNPGLTVLIVPDTMAGVVTLRNAQGALVMPPIQPEPYLHRVLPTLTTEVQNRPGQFQLGLAWQLTEQPPQNLDTPTLARLFQPGPSGLPDSIACWNGQTGVIILLVDQLGDEWFDAPAWRQLETQIQRACPSSP